MSHSDPFDEVLKAAFRSEPLPPVPGTALAAWKPSESSGSKWLFLMPGTLFVLGLVVGVWLAPLGLGAAFTALKSVLGDILAGVSSETLAWALALSIAVAVIAADGLWRRIMR